jgi:hypothetical protein
LHLHIQVSRAGHIATDGEVMASPQAMKVLATCCEMSREMELSDSPVCIASRGQLFVSLQPKQAHMLEFLPREDGVHTPVYENLRRHCAHLHRNALSRLHLQMALYVHPVVRGDELVISQRAKTQSRHVAEAELRSVYTMFIKALVSPRTTGQKNIDEALFKTLGDIMHVTSRELDRYSGQLRQFIVDDKGKILSHVQLETGLSLAHFDVAIGTNQIQAWSLLPRSDCEALPSQTCEYLCLFVVAHPPSSLFSDIVFLLWACKESPTTRYQQLSTSIQH